MKILVINCGSSCIKYELFDMENNLRLSRGACTAIGFDTSVVHGATLDGRHFQFNDISLPDHKAAVNTIKEVLTTGECKVIDNIEEVTAIGHFIAHGGDRYTESILIDDSVVKGIADLSTLAPLHNPANVIGINACTEVFGEKLPQVAVFDTAFHSTMPKTAYMFGLPYEYYEKYHVRRYGAQGISHRFVAYRTAEIIGKDLKDFKLITCHLGNGCSITAIKDGKVLDTSMGLTPQDGLMMATRCGAVDPSAITYIMEKEYISPKDMDTIINKKSGVLGISGVHCDDREVKKVAVLNGDKRAKLARDMQCYQTLKVIGSYVAAMDGVDVITFTGAIGENSADLREHILSNLSYLGIKFNKDINNATIYGNEGEITVPDCPVRAFVVAENTSLAIARDAYKIIKDLI